MPLRRPSAPRIASAVAVLLLLPSSFASAQPGVIPPGREAIVVPLVRGALEEAGFRPGVDIQIAQTQIVFEVVELADGDGPAPHIVLGAPRIPLTDELATLGNGVGLRCETPCTDEQLARAGPLAGSLVRARALVVDEVWLPAGPGVSREAPRRPTVTWVLLVTFVVGTLLLFGDVLRREPWRVLLALALVVVVGALLRVFAVEPQLMGVNSHQREIPWLWRLKFEGVPILALMPDGANRFAQASLANLVASVALVPVIYAHARVLFDERRPALFAAALFAILPVPVAFSQSEVLLISSTFFASVSLTALQRYATSERRWLVGAYGVLAIAAYLLATEARPLSFLLALVFVPALFAYGGARLRRPRDIAMVIAATAAATVVVLTVYTRGFVSGAPGVGSAPPQLENLVEVVLDLPTLVLVTNNYFRPDITPVVVTLLGGVGLWAMWRRRRSHLVYLAVWFTLIFAGHCLVGAHTRIINARYGMHSIVPVVLAAAFGLEYAVTFLRRWRPERRSTKPAALALAGAVAVATSLPAYTLWAPIEDDVNAEHRFLMDLEARGIPELGAVVVEAYDDHEVPRYDHLGTHVHGAGERADLIVVDSVRRHDGPVYFYQGLPCVWRRGEQALSPRCREVAESALWERVDSRRIGEPLHDISSGRQPPNGGEIVLYRFVGR